MLWIIHGSDTSDTEQEIILDSKVQIVSLEAAEQPESFYLTFYLTSWDITNALLILRVCKSLSATLHHIVSPWTSLQLTLLLSNRGQ